MPEYMLRVDDGNIINTILTNSKSDMFSSLYRYESEYVNFIFSRIHYYIVAWFEDNSARIYKGNRYLTSGSRGDIQNFINIFNQFRVFFEKNGYEFEIEPKYLSKIQEISEFVYTNNDQKFVLPESYSPIDKNIIDEPIISLKKNQRFASAKYLIFGVSTAKPDIRIRQVMDGEIEIVNSDDMLIYDREIGESLLYKDFNSWWNENKDKYSWYEKSRHLQKNELKVQKFYKRNYYHEEHPVLIPQVYLHYDPKSKEERKNCKFNDELTFQRMDFLIIYGGKRIIIEIDGYSHLMDKGRVDIVKYARQLEYDRTMKFLGYDIFRICNCELDEKNLDTTLKNFFTNLYNYLGIK